MKTNLELQIEDVNLILACLSEQPYKIVHELIHRIQQQVIQHSEKVVCVDVPGEEGKGK